MLSEFRKPSPKKVMDRSTGETPSLINTLTCKFDIVRKVAASFGMKESIDNWDVYWTDTSITVDRCKEMKRYQRINHFPGMFEICRKDQLARNLKRLQKLHPEEFAFFPQTWCLRSEISEVLEHAKTHRNDVYIIKPNIGCQGKGICITNNVNRLKKCDDVICQVYLQKPLLIDGYKFDLRVYVLITSCDPLRIFVYNEGLARFATAKYRRPDCFNAGNQFMHLTNYSVNKHSQAYVVGEDGTKRRLSSINQWFVNNNYDLKRIWRDIDDAIVKTVMASLPTVRHEYHVAFPHGSSYACFEILGFDFIFDSQIRPYILEVNHAPSLQTDTDIDSEVKDALLQDTFNILKLQTTNRVDILAEERRRAWERLFTVTHQGSVLSRERARNEVVAKQKIDWENSHVGNFRKIYPGRKTAHYEQFFTAKSTLFSGTCSSRAKEICSPKYKTTHYKLFKMQKMPLSSKPSDKVGAVKVGKRPLQNKNSKTTKPKPHSVTNKIDDSEEKERIRGLRKRDSLVKSYGLFEKVFENFKTAGLVRKSDEIKMQEMCLGVGGGGSCGEPLKTINIAVHDALESITKAMDAADKMNSETSNFKSNKICDFKAGGFQPAVIDELEEIERVSSIERRSSLLESIGIHKVVHDYFKQSGLLKIEERVKSKAGFCSQRGKTSQKDDPLKVNRPFRVKSCLSVRKSSETYRTRAKTAERSSKRRSWCEKDESESSRKIHRVVGQLETLIKLWKEGHKCGENSCKREATVENEDSPQIWATPPEESPAMEIQPEFHPNPELH